jgi:hypothetical protein
MDGNKAIAWRVGSTRETSTISSICWFYHTENDFKLYGTNSKTKSQFINRQ